MSAVISNTCKHLARRQWCKTSSLSTSGRLLSSVKTRGRTTSPRGRGVTRFQGKSCSIRGLCDPPLHPLTADNHIPQVGGGQPPAGDRLPDVTLCENVPQNEVNIAELFRGKKGILFSVVGAFTPGCSQAHIPEYLNNHDRFKEEGFEVVACVSVNDPFVMAAWGEDLNIQGRIRLLADPRCEFTKQIGMELDTSSLLGTKRSKRYSMLIEDSVVKHINMDPDSSGLACLLCIRLMYGTKRPTTS